MRMTRHRAARAALAALTVFAFAACGDDDDEAATTTTEAAAAAETVDVTAVDYAFQGLPAEVDAGTSFTLTNSSTAELHELVAIRLPDGETRPIAELVALPQEEQEALASGPPATVIIAPPTQGGMAVVGDGTLTQPGRYLIGCFIPVGADPQEYMEAAQQSQGEPPQVEGGPPHITQGMYAEVTVQ